MLLQLFPRKRLGIPDESGHVFLIYWQYTPCNHKKEHILPSKKKEAPSRCISTLVVYIDMSCPWFQGSDFAFPWFSTSTLCRSHPNPLPGIRQSGDQSAEQSEASREADQTEEQTDPEKQSLDICCPPNNAVISDLINDYHILTSIFLFQ